MKTTGYNHDAAVVITFKRTVMVYKRGYSTGVARPEPEGPDEYWRDLDANREYPEEFVRAMTEAGYLAALIPEDYGGMGPDLTAACAILEGAKPRWYRRPR